MIRTSVMVFSLDSLLMLAGVIQGIIISIVLLDKKRRNFRANRYLAALLLAMTIRLLNSFLTRAVPPDIFPVTGRYSLFLIFSFMPLLYFYVRTLTEPGFSFRPACWAHFVPAALTLFYTVPFYLSVLFTPEASRSYGRDWTWENALINTLVVLQQIMYGVWIVRAVSAYRRRITDLVSSLERIRLSWILCLLGALAVLTLFLSGIVIYRLLGGVSAPVFAHRDLIYAAIMAVTIYAAGYFALSQPEIFSPPLAREAAKKYEGSSLSPAKAEEHLRLLLAIMENDAVYRDETLSLPSLAEKIGLPAYLLSQLLNERLKKNFYDFVNGYRIEEAKRILRDPRRRDEKILGIAFDTGFASKVAFNRVFKKYTGMTPSEYKLKPRE